MQKIVVNHNKYEMIRYQGSLDFPCDFCNLNSYDNIHFKKDGDIKFVICKDCIDRVF